MKEEIVRPEKTIEEEPIEEEPELIEEEMVEPIEEFDLAQIEPPRIIEPQKEENPPIEISEFVCQKCGKKFPNKGLLNAHSKRCGEKVG